MMIEKWLCLYIYCCPPFEKLLVECIDPMIENLLVKNQAEKFFFIRYGEGGPHIRLRINFATGELLQLNRSGIIEKITKFSELTNTSQLTNSKALVLEKQYEPEYGRYGGMVGIEIAEQLFNFSSLQTLKLIKSSTNWHYNWALYSTLRVNLIMMNQLIDDYKELIDFYLLSFNTWLLHLCYNHEAKTIDKTLRAEKLEKFAHAFENAKYWLLPTVENIISRKIETSIDREWSEVSTIIRCKIQANKEEMLSDTKNKRKLHSIYDSYCHMNNNRLGIKNADESLIAFLVLRTLIMLNGKGRAVNPE